MTHATSTITPAATTRSFDAAKREEASALGYPIDRASYAQVRTPEAMLVVSTRDRAPVAALVQSHRVVARYAGREALDKIAQASSAMFDHRFNKQDTDPESNLSADCGSLAFDTRNTAQLAARRLSEHAQFKTGKDSVWAAHRRINYLLSLGAGYSMYVLTDVLTARYWAPAETDTSDITAWAALFGTGVDGQGLYELVRLGADGAVNNEVHPRLGSTELSVMRSVQWSSMKSNMSVFDQSAKFIDYAEFRDALDPALLERNLLSGTVSALSYHGESSMGARFSVEGNCNFKESERLTLFHPQEQKTDEATVECLSLGDDDRLEAVLIPKDRRGLKFASIGKTLHATRTVFSMFPGSRGERMWTKHESFERIEGRQVPLSVVLAGTVTSDQTTVNA